MTKRYRVTLTPAEREELEGLLARGKADVRRLKHAQILLKTDEADGGTAWSDARIAEAVEAGITTVERVRRRCVEEGLASALSPYRGGKRIWTQARWCKGGAPDRAGLFGATRGPRPLDVTPARPAHGRAGLCGYALA